MRARIVVTRTMTDPVMERIRSEFDAILPPAAGLTPDEVIAAIKNHQAEGLLFTSGTKFDASFIERLPSHLKVAATCSVGFDHIDVAAAKARGLVVTNTPDVLNNATADMAFMLILAACRRAGEYDRVVRDGWGKFYGMHEFLGTEVSGKTLGIIGMGRIGQAVAQRARGFDMKVVYHNRSRLPAQFEAGATYFEKLEDMLPQSQILTLHAPGGAETSEIVNRDTLALLPRGAVLVNTARGTLVNEEDLIAALNDGHLFAAGLDVFKGEPKPDARFASLPNVVLAPHMGSATFETRTAMGNRCLDNVAAVLAGRPASDPIW
ncbi:dihydrofolate reductase [Aminobacter aminovorans]|uniref:Dihydrofolate reductase n=3 Tax=Aminobacter aminovorans TaxID=83263 RepID=A0AAC8YKJ0_AMIAI|nr:D-glycerate dehydrogenase [Aminobacter aminovorans]AMS40120.1 dihydrofolate reductase [Aminobacter aminovorans]